MKFEMDGIADFIGQLTKVYDDAEVMYKRAAYAGARILADEVKKGLNGLRVTGARWGTPEEPLDGVIESTKAALIDRMGVSKIENDGQMTTVSVGFSGYGHATKKYPQGIPIQMLARSVESGTSFMRKQPFIRAAVNRAKKQVDAEIEKEVTAFFEQRIK